MGNEKERERIIILYPPGIIRVMRLLLGENSKKKSKSDSHIKQHANDDVCICFIALFQRWGGPRPPMELTLT